MMSGIMTTHSGPINDGTDNSNNSNTSSSSSIGPINFEEKYAEQLEESDRLYEIICRKDTEIKRLQTLCHTLHHRLGKNKESFEKEKKDWNRYKDDLLLVVRAADSYHNEAMAIVEKHKMKVKQYKALNSELWERIDVLHEQLTESNPKLPRSSSCPHFTDDFRELEDAQVTEVMEEDSLPISEYDTANTMEMDPTTSDENSFVDCADGLEFLMPPCLSPTLPSTTPLIPTTKFENNKENFERGSFRVPKESSTETLSIISQNKGPLKRRSKGAAFFSSFQSVEKETPQERDPFQNFMRLSGGSKRNALLRWCQNRTSDYNFVEITNFSTSWRDGMALNALLHSYLPDQIPYDTLRPENCVDNFQLAFQVAEAASIPHSLTIEDMLSEDRPSWEKVMNYVKDIYSTLENTVIE